MRQFPLLPRMAAVALLTALGVAETHATITTQKIQAEQQQAQQAAATAAATGATAPGAPAIAAATAAGRASVLTGAVTTAIGNLKTKLDPLIAPTRITALAADGSNLNTILGEIDTAIDTLNARALSTTAKANLTTALGKLNALPGGVPIAPLAADASNVAAVLTDIGVKSDAVAGHITTEINKIQAAIDGKSGAAAIGAIGTVAGFNALIPKLVAGVSDVETHAKTTAPFPATVVTEVNKLVRKLDTPLTGKPSAASVNADGKNLGTVVTALQGLIDDAVAKAASGGLTATEEAIAKADVGQLYTEIDALVANHPDDGKIKDLFKPAAKDGKNLLNYFKNRMRLIKGVPTDFYGNAHGIHDDQNGADFATLAQNLKQAVMAVTKDPTIGIQAKTKINSSVPSLLAP